MAVKFLKRRKKNDPSGDVVAVDLAASGGQAEYDRLTDPTRARSRGAYWEDVTPAPGGSSSFAHLIEDGDLAAERTDWGFVAATVADLTDTFAYLDPSGRIDSVLATDDERSIGIRVVEDDEYRHTVNSDGTHLWGDGTAAPNIALSKTADDNLLLSGAGLPDLKARGFNASSSPEDPSQSPHGVMYPDGSIYSNSDDESTYAGLLPTGAFEAVGPGGTGFHAEGGAGNNIMRITGNGAGIRLTSPDGALTKTIRLSDAGAVEVVA